MTVPTGAKRGYSGREQHQRKLMHNRSQDGIDAKDSTEREPENGLRTGSPQQRIKRGGWDHDRPPEALPSGTLRKIEEGTVSRELPAQSDTGEEDPQAPWGRTVAGHPDNLRPDDSAGDPSGIKPAL